MWSLLVELGDAARAELRRCPLSSLVLRTHQSFTNVLLVLVGSFDLKSHLRLDVQSCSQLRLQLRHPLLALLDVDLQAHLCSIRFREIRLDGCHLVSVRPLRMRLVLVAGLLSFVVEILHSMAQVLKLAILRVTSCLKVVALD